MGRGENGARLDVTVTTSAAAASDACVEELAARGVHLPLQHRSAWLCAFASGPSWFITVRDEHGCAAGLGVQAARWRVLPGHWVLRVRRFGGAAGQAATVAALEALRSLAHAVPRVLRLDLEVFSPDETRRGEIARALSNLGFRQSDLKLSYRDTVVIDLRPAETELLASFHATARRHIRAVEKRPVHIEIVNDPAYASRLGELFRESLVRSGGVPRPRDWTAWIQLANARPDLARIIGTFSTEATGPEALWAFAIGYHHGDHVEYGIAASTRHTHGVRVPLGYALAWDLIKWARGTGARWFDFGGITAGSHGASDPLGGVSDFKRYFSRNVITVCSQWSYEPRPVRAALARRISSFVRRGG